jgi:S1-C subfamily serine protease
MKLSPLLTLTLSACVHAPHMEPQVRSQYDQEYSVVVIESECGGDLPSLGGNPWDSYKVGSGVVISERYVLTAAHVTSCPEIPRVHVTFIDGSRFIVDVNREDLEGDLARLEIFSAGNFNKGVRPPTLAVPAPYDLLCAVTGFPNRESHCGDAVTAVTAMFPAVSGNSGSPVYDDVGDLVGLVEASIGDAATRFVPVDASWLSGT